MYGILEDLRFALRLIAGNRTLSLTVFFSLALGVGASTSVFGLIDAFVLRPLPIPQPDGVVQITSVNPASAIDPSSYPDFDDLRKRATAFEAVTTARAEGAAIETHNGAPSRITVGLIVSGDFLKVIRIQPALGRAFRPAEDQTPDRDAVAMISYAMWQRDFGGSRDVIGKTIRVNSTEFTIIGVVPQTFTGLNAFIHEEFYVPRMMEHAMVDPGVHPLTDRTYRDVAVYARLKPGVSIYQARMEVARIASQLEQENPATNRGRSMGVYTPRGFRMAEKPGIFMGSMFFLLVGGLVLGIACVNVANLMLSTVPARTRETAVRLAMGAPRIRLIRQFIVESCVVSAAASTAGLGIAMFVARWLRSLEVSSGLPLFLEVRIDARMALFAFAVGVGSGILSGLIPAIRCSRGDLNHLMRSGDPRVSASKAPFRQILVRVQITLATVVLVVSGHALQSLWRMKNADPGFRVNNISTMAFSPIQSRGFTIRQSHQFYRALVERVRKTPGVESSALGHHVPLGALGNSRDVVIEGYAMPEGQHSLSIASGIIGEGYFDLLDIPVLRGRSFNFHDTNDAPKVVVINQAMAEKYWPGRDAIGKRIEIVGTKPASAEIIGIVRTAKYRNLNEQALPFMYMPLEQTDETFMYLFTATTGDAASFIPVVRNAVREVDPSQPIYDIHTMTDTVRRQALFENRITAQIATGAASVGLILGVLGLYGMLAYSVSRRTREIGVRIAVGATGGRIFRMIVRDGLKLSVAGIAFGLLLSSALAAAMKEMIASSDPDDPLVYGVVVAVLVAVTLLSCYYPARRAARIDPNECLRCE
jgi:predicted permease